MPLLRLFSMTRQWSYLRTCGTYISISSAKLIFFPPLAKFMNVTFYRNYGVYSIYVQCSTIQSTTSGEVSVLNEVVSKAVSITNCYIHCHEVVLCPLMCAGDFTVAVLGSAQISYVYTLTVCLETKLDFSKFSICFQYWRRPSASNLLTTHKTFPQRRSRFRRCRYFISLTWSPLLKNNSWNSEIMWYDGLFWRFLKKSLVGQIAL